MLIECLLVLRLLRSNCVAIHAGEGDCKFTVHEALLSKSSSPSLQKLVKPGWRESSEGCIDWRHTSSQTVERVLTWLYLRDYQSPDPVPREVGDPGETGSGRHASEAREDSQPTAERYKGVDETPVEVEFNDAPIDLAVEPEPDAEAAPEVATDEPEPEADAVPDEPQPEVGAALDDPAAEPNPLEAEDPELQNAIFESCSVRPLTPLGRCAGVPPVMTAYKTAAGLFEDREFSMLFFEASLPLQASPRSTNHS